MLTHATAERTKTVRPNAAPAPVTAAARWRARTGAFLQRMATVGRADDPAESEAERVAARVTARLATPVADAGEGRSGRPGVALHGAAPSAATTEVVQRQTDPTPEDGERPGEYLIQPAPGFGAAAPPPPSRDFDRRLAALRRTGRPLPGPLRTRMEGAFGEDFSAVRVIDGVEADRLSRAIQARAFTVSHDIVFAEGALQPDRASGRELIAHELTHVVQQRGPAPDSAVSLSVAPTAQRDIFPDLGVTEFIGDQIMSLLEYAAPEVVPIIEEGPFNWLTGKIAGAFDGVVGRVTALSPGRAVDTLITTFTGMVETATAIATGLANHDCGPLCAALNQMKDFVTDVAGQAWDKLTEFFQPVTDFFSELWDGMSAAGTAALDWLKDFGGELWSRIERTGEMIWEATAPVRRLGQAAIDWFMEKLFGPQGANQDDSKGGIVGWFTDKALEAWEWIKDRTRPVWEPVSDAITTVREMIPPPFLAELGQQMTELSGDMSETLDGMEGGPGLAENREALASVIPSLDDMITMVRTAIAAAGVWLSVRVQSAALLISSFVGRIRANAILSALASPLSWLETAATSLLGWVSEKVLGLFDFLGRAFDMVTPFIRWLVELAQKIINFYADIYGTLPALIQGAWELIPECIREPIKDFVIEQILGRIPVFRQLVAVENLWTRLQETAFSVLRSLFVDGDIARAAWTFFSSMVRIIGLPPELITEILIKAASSIGQILQDPVGFLINTLKAMGRGFQLFYDNVWSHLLGGVADWLFGHVREAGLTPPRDFSLGSIIPFVLEVLGISVDNVLERMKLQIDPSYVDRIRDFLDVATGVWRFVSVIFNEGIGGLWEFVEEELTNLWDLVLDAVVGWATEQIVTQVIGRLIRMLDPTGIMAVIEAALSIYRAIRSAVRYLERMLRIVARVLDAVGGIVTGALGQAAEFMEGALGRAVPVAIGFLADQIPLTGLSDRIAEFVAGVRETVVGAIDWLIEKAVSAGRGFLDLLARGREAVSDAIGAIANWWNAREAFDAEDGSDHDLYFQGEGESAVLMISSETPQSYRSFIESLDVVTPEQANDKAEALQILSQIDEVKREARRGGPTSATAENPDPHASTMQDLLSRLADATKGIMGSAADNRPSEPPQYGALRNGFGTSVVVPRLKVPVPPGGGEPSVTSSDWADLLLRKHSGNTSYYVRGHLLNGDLGGPGTMWANLTPLTQRANNWDSDSHFKGFERDLKEAVLTENAIVRFEVHADYAGSDPARLSLAENLEAQGNQEDRKIARVIRAEQKIPSTLTCLAYKINSEGQPDPEAPNPKEWRHPVDNSIATGPDEYNVTGAPASSRDPVYLSGMSWNDFQSNFGIAEELAKKLAGRSYRQWNQVFAQAGSENAAEVARIRDDNAKKVRLFTIGA